MAAKKAKDSEEKDNREYEDIMMEMHNIAPDVRIQSVNLRQNMSGFEKMVWNFLGKDENPWGFLRQWPVEGFFLDFFTDRYNVALEADGPHHRDADDKVRDRVLSKKGITTIRLTPADFVRKSKGELFVYLRNALENVNTED